MLKIKMALILECVINEICCSVGDDGEFALIFRPTSGILQLTNARGVSPRWEGVR